MSKISLNNLLIIILRTPVNIIHFLKFQAYLKKKLCLKNKIITYMFLVIKIIIIFITFFF